MCRWLANHRPYQRDDLVYPGFYYASLVKISQQLQMKFFLFIPALSIFCPHQHAIKNCHT